MLLFICYVVVVNCKDDVVAVIDVVLLMLVCEQQRLRKHEKNKSEKIVFEVFSECGDISGSSADYNILGFRVRLGLQKVHDEKHPIIFEKGSE